MSRFSKAEAEARGWVFVHERGEYDLVTSETQGETRYTPGTVRAEKYVSLPGRGTALINEEAETTGKLLERIAAYEAHLESFADYSKTTPRPIADSEVPLNEAGLQVHNVIARDADGNVVYLTEAEWAGRDRTDAIFDGEKMVNFGATPAAEEAGASVNDQARYKEDLRAAEFDVGPTKQVTYDTADRIDSPGQGAGGVLIVREDEDSLEDVAARREAESVAQEEIRVSDLAGLPLERIPSPVGQDELAGVDVSIQHRGDLDSERPRQDETAEAAADPTPSVVEPPDTETADEVRSEATEDEAQAIRDEEGREEADKVQGRSDAVEAGAEAEQDVADEAAQEQATDEGMPEPPESLPGDTDGVAATGAAKAYADQHGVNLAEVQGTGKDGRVTRPDVEKYLDENE